MRAVMTSAAGIVVDEWLTQVAKRRVYRVDVPAGAASGEVAEACAEHQRMHAGASYYAKVPTTAIDCCRGLRAAGFYPVDASVTLTRASQMALPAANGVTVIEAEHVHHAAAMDVAGACFQYSRFHLDPGFSREQADAIKREWVRSYAEGRRGDRLLVAIVDGQVAGFLAALTSATSGAPSAVIDLIGVRRQSQKQGVGGALVRAFAAIYSHSAARLLVGTQAANVPSLRFYERCGFTVDSTAFVLHAHS